MDAVCARVFQNEVMVVSERPPVLVENAGQFAPTQSAALCTGTCLSVTSTPGTCHAPSAAPSVTTAVVLFISHFLGWACSTVPMA